MNARTALMGVLFSVMWSSAFTSARMIVLDAPPFLALGARFLISGMLGVGIAALLGQRIRLSPAEWRALVVLGVCQNTIYLGLCFVAVQWVAAGVVVIIASLLPLLVAVASWVFLRERRTWLGLAGLAAGVIGVAVIMAGKIAGGIDLRGVVATLIGVTALAAATLLVGGRFAGNPNTLMLVGLQMLVGFVTVLPVSWLFESWVVRPTVSLAVAFAWTTLVPGLLATLVWFVLVGRIGPTAAAAFHFLNPFFGVAIAALILGEPFTSRDVVGVLIVMLGILAVQLSRRRVAAGRS
ncbi:MAG: DMT family transporter [Burkholderiaceae bacterium]